MPGALLTYVPDVFSLKGGKWGWAGVPASASLQAGPGGPVQANRISIFLEGKVNVCWCHEFWSSSKNKIRHCEHFLDKF